MLQIKDHVAQPQKPNKPNTWCLSPRTGCIRHTHHAHSVPTPSPGRSPSRGTVLCTPISSWKKEKETHGQRETLARLSGLKDCLTAIRSNHWQEGPQRPGSPRTPGGWRSWVRIPDRSRKLWLDPPSGSFCSCSHREKRKRSSNRLFLVNCPGRKANTKTVSQNLVFNYLHFAVIYSSPPPSPSNDSRPFCSTAHSKRHLPLRTDSADHTSLSPYSTIIAFALAAAAEQLFSVHVFSRISTRGSQQVLFGQASLLTPSWKQREIGIKSLGSSNLNWKFLNFLIDRIL